MAGKRSWIRVDSSGESQLINLDKFTMMRRYDLPARDLRLLDPVFIYPSTILGREKAIVVNLVQIRCIITTEEVLILKSSDNYVSNFVMELKRSVTTSAAGEVWQQPAETSDLSRRRRNRSYVFGSASADYFPFEFRALEVALGCACINFDSEADELETELYPLLDERTSKTSTINLERVRRLKSRLVALTRRVQKVRDEIEQLTGDDGDMAEMYLTEKKRRMETSFNDDHHSLPGNKSVGGASISALVSPTTSGPDFQKLEKSIARSRHESNAVKSYVLEMLLEAYFRDIDLTLNKLTALKEYFDDTEDFICIHLDNVRNQLIKIELILITVTIVLAIFGVVAGIFGMNFAIPMFDHPGAFKWVLIITGIIGFTIFCVFVCFLKYKTLMPS